MAYKAVAIVYFALILKYIADKVKHLYHKSNIYASKSEELPIVIHKSEQYEQNLVTKRYNGYDNQENISFACELAKHSYIESCAEMCRSQIILNNLDINKKDIKTQLNIFQNVCLSGNSNFIEELIPYADLSARTQHMDSPLLLIVYGYLHSIHKDLKCVNSVITHGINVNDQNKSGFTALHYAATMGDVELVHLLLDKGANIHISTFMKRTYPLDCAELFGHLEVVKILKNHERKFNRAICYTEHNSFEEFKPIRRTPQKLLRC